MLTQMDDIIEEGSENETDGNESDETDGNESDCTLPPKDTDINSEV